MIMKDGSTEAARLPRAAVPAEPRPHCLLLTFYFLLMVCTGCESFQRKFTRKPKHPQEAPSPIISFQEYGKALTPLDLYRKHYLMFVFWNDELIAALKDRSLNPKRIVRDSEEALKELQHLSSVLDQELAPRMQPLIEERRKLHAQMDAAAFSHERSLAIRRKLEAQTRKIQREWFWRDVEEHVEAVVAEPAA